MIVGSQSHVWSGPKSMWPLHFKNSLWWKRRSQSNFASHSTWGTNRVCMWMQDGYKVYMGTSMTSNGSCFMVTWTIFRSHLLEVGLTKNRENMALRMLTTVDLFYLVMCDDPREYKFSDIAFGWGPGHIRLHTTLAGPWPQYMISDVTWDGLWTLSFGLLQFHGHGSWLVCEVALKLLSFDAYFSPWVPNGAKWIKRGTKHTRTLSAYNIS